MLALTLDTSSAAISVGITELGDDLIARAEQQVINAKGHGELLAPTIDAALQQAGIRPSDLDAIVAGLGPGPYTGLRVGLITAAAMADALNIPTYGVCSLDGFSEPESEDLIVVTDARRKEVYWARYEHGGTGQRIDGPHVGRPEDVPQDGIVVGAGAALYPAIFPPTDRDWFPAPGVLWARAQERIRSGAPSEPLIPMYLRHPDAVVPGAPKQVSQ